MLGLYNKFTPSDRQMYPRMVTSGLGLQKLIATLIIHSENQLT